MAGDEDKNYTVKLGSNLVENCNGLINLVGEKLNEQPFRLREGGHGEIFLDCSIFDEHGNKILELVNSDPKKISKDYEIHIENTRIVLSEKATGNIWFDLLRLGPGDFRLNGIFYYPGIEIYINDEYLIVNDHPLTFNTFTNCENILNM